MLMLSLHIHTHKSPKNYSNSMSLHSLSSKQRYISNFSVTKFLTAKNMVSHTMNVFSFTSLAV